MKFTRENYHTFIELFKHELIDFHTPGNGVILRHDVDENLNRAFKMAQLEHELGVFSTYFVLDTAEYWKETDTMLTIKRMQNDYGHEIGWHNNAITEYLRLKKPVKECIMDPLLALRSAGIRVTTTASHGDPMCHEKNFINYNVFGFKASGFTGYNGEMFPMEDFGLEVEAYHNRHTHYISDSHGRWNPDNDKILEKYMEHGGRLQILIHPEWWDL